MRSRRCQFVMPNGTLCRSSPLTGEDYCLFHSPDHREEADEARRLGGLRRRKEKALVGAYDFPGLHTVTDIQRLPEIAALDTLALENSDARSRALAYLAQTALKCLEVGELEERLGTLEGILRDTGPVQTTEFDLDLAVVRKDESKELAS